MIMSGLLMIMSGLLMIRENRVQKLKVLNKNRMNEGRLLRRNSVRYLRLPCLDIRNSGSRSEDNRPVYVEILKSRCSEGHSTVVFLAMGPSPNLFRIINSRS